MNDSDSNEAPLPKDNSPINNFTICPECFSRVEILNINEENSTIEYRCIKEDKTNLMSIKQYLKKINECKIPQINEIKDKCKCHINKDYICYCFDCKLHLCEKCLKTRIHINHNKAYIIEIKPIEEEIEIVEEVIKDYDKKLKELINEKITKTNEYKEKENLEKNILHKILEKKYKINNNKKKEELKENNNNFMKDIEEIKKKYEKEIKLRKKKYENENHKIKNNYKLINDVERIKYQIKIEKIILKYKNEINKHEFEKRIENYDNMLKINKMIFNIYYHYNNNYYNSLNMNSLLMYYINSKYINDKIIQIKLKDKYDEIIKIIKHKRIEDNKMKIDKKKNENEIKELKIKLSHIL